jgi:hypothetical protein
MFRAIYDSPWHNPAAFWAAGVAFLAWWMRKRPFLVAFVALFTVEILADALATGGWSPLALLHSRWESPAAIAFVIVGDFRYFLLVERFVRRPGAKAGDATAPSAWAAAVGLSFLVPVVSAVLNRTLTAGLADTRWTFLVYEALFVALALALRFVLVPRRLAAAPAPVRAWLLRVTTFELAQYVLWALADVIILAGVDAGFALRLVPDAMYYMLFLPFVALTAPAEVEG